MSFAKRSAVEDRDHGWRGITRSISAVDGLELRAGIMNWRLRYPKKGTEIAKVAGIHEVYNAIIAGYDAERGTIEAAMEKLHTYLISGKPGIAEFIYQNFGLPLRKAMRERAMQIVTRRTGRMEESIRATVFDDVKPGRKGPMHAGKVAAGDDPLKPRPSQKIAP